MNLIESVCKFATEQGFSQDEALKKGMEGKSKEIMDKGAGGEVRQSAIY